MSWLSSKLGGQGGLKFVTNLMVPEEIKQFRKIVQDLPATDSPIPAGDFLLEKIIPKLGTELNKYHLDDEMRKLVAMYTSLFFTSQGKMEESKKVIDFLSKSILITAAIQSTFESYVSIVIKILELNTKELCEYALDFVNLALIADTLIPIFFGGTNISRLWQFTYVLNENTNVVYGSLLLEIVSHIRFMNPDYFIELIKISYVCFTNPDQKFVNLTQAIEFISYVVCNYDCTNYLVQLMPKILQLSPKLTSLSCFENFLKAPVVAPAVTWTPLSEICASKEATLLTFHSALNAIVRTKLIPPPDSFSFDSFAKVIKQLSKEDIENLFNIVQQCDCTTKTNFVAACLPLEDTGCNDEDLSKLVYETQWDQHIGLVLNAIIVNVDTGLLMKYLETRPEYFAMCNAACNQIYPDCKATVAVLMKFIEMTRHNFELVSSLLSKLLDRANVTITIPQVVLELQKDIPDFTVNCFANAARRIPLFNREFFKQDYIPCLKNLTTTRAGLGLLAALAIDGPVQEIDDFVSNNWSLFEKWDEKDLKNVMYGVPPGSDTVGFIRIPSIIPHVKITEARNPFDKLQLSKYMVNPSRDDLKLFISQAIPSENLNSIIHDTELIKLATDPLEPQKGSIMFHPAARDPVVNTLAAPAISFWMLAWDVTMKTPIISYNNLTIELCPDGIIAFGGQPYKIEMKKWILISIFNDQKVLTAYVNGVQIGQSSSIIPKYINFGGSNTASTWLLSSSIFTEENVSNRESQMKSLIDEGPYVQLLANIKISPGAKVTNYEGLLRHFDAIGGKEFIFNEIINCQENEFDKLADGIRAAFNMSKLKVFMKLQFFRLMKYTIFRKDNMYSTEFENVIFECLTNSNGELDVASAFSIYTDYRILNSQKINFSFIHRLIEHVDNTPEMALFLHYLLDIFSFFMLSNEAADHCLNLIEIFVQKFPILLQKIALVMISTAHIETDDVTELFEEGGNEIQKKFFKLLTRNKDTFSETIQPKTAFSYATLVHNQLALNLLEFISIICIEKPDYFSLPDFKKMKNLFRSESTNPKTWTVLFTFLTMSKHEQLSEYKEETIKRNDLIPVILNSMRNIINPENDKLCTEIIEVLMTLISKNQISLAQYSRKISILCSLGFNERDLAGLTNALVRLDDTKVRRRNLGKTIRASFDSAEDNRMIQFKDELRYMDKVLYNETVDYLNLHPLVVDNSNYVEPEPPKLPENLKDYFNLECTTQIARMAAQAIFQAAFLGDDKFKTVLIHLTINGADVAPEIIDEMHRKIIIEFLALNLSAMPPNTRVEFFTFLICRIIEGWWTGYIDEIYAMASLQIIHEIPEIIGGFVITILSQAPNDEMKLFIANKVVSGELFSVIVQNSKIFSSFIAIIVTKEISSKPEAQELYTLIASKLKESEMTIAFRSGNALAWLDLKPTIPLSFQDYFKDMFDEAVSNSQQIQKERQFITRKPSGVKVSRDHLFSTHHACFIRRAFRFQFFIHYNLSSQALNYAIDGLFKLAKSQEMATKEFAKYMYCPAPSPFVPPVKLMPLIISYEATFKKNSSKVPSPMSIHKQPFIAKADVIMQSATAAKVYDGWCLPSFVQFGAAFLAKLIYKPVEPLFPCGILNTPESLSCVGMIAQDAFYIITNASYLNNGEIVMNDISDQICHAALIESLPFNMVGKTTLFFNHSVIKISFKDISLIIPRKFIHEDTALDIYTFQGNSFSIILPESERKLISQKTFTYKFSAKRGPVWVASILSEKPQNIAEMWANGELSTFDYLLYLNALGLRSFNDYAQYPVFPWVIGDYIHENGYDILRDFRKPLGMIGEVRAERYKQMYLETGEKYFYGTHYSYPACVLHFMMRCEPYTLYNVMLHSGFDHKDRLFVNIAESWHSASASNQADLKELIPQFFCTFEYLTNMNNIPLSVRTDGTDLANVILPVWAKSPKEFMVICRRVLESPSVALQLPDWIDLVFGYKQTGQAAIEACNLFHPLSYEDQPLQHVDDQREMKAQVDAINNFGQTPHQIFDNPSTRFKLKDTTQLNNTDYSVVQLKNMSSKAKSLIHVDDDLIALPRLEHQMCGANVKIFSRCFEVNREIMIEEANFNIRCSNVSSDNLLLVTGSDYGVVTSFIFREGKPVKLESTPLFNRIETVAVSSHLSLILAATKSKIYSLDLSSGFPIRTVEIPNVKYIAFDETSYLVYAVSLKSITVMTQNLEKLCKTKVETDITSLAASDNTMWTQSPFFVTGHANGTVNMWTVDIVSGKLEKKELMRFGDVHVTAVCIFGNGRAVAAINKKGQIYIAVSTNIRKSLLKYSLFDSCPCCKSPLTSEKLQFCPMCGLPVCEHCISPDGCTKCTAKLAIDTNPPQ